ncbi:hypothetical protein [Nocardiopsis halotolerans]|uniref:hypothetical protein n=1 Tax=Nocardiopsis halotolerans TaxID=124252 RepID=UPI0003636944|nr:hypothetical protein [Nocardiopsis halotolerans]
MRFRILLGVTLVVVGAVLALFFWNTDFFWFRGGPLGVLMLVVGVFEVGEQLWRARRRGRSGGVSEAAGDGEGTSGTEQDGDRS